MQATITFLLSEQAQRAQIAATGQPVARKQTTTEDIPVEWLTSPYCKISPDGAVSFTLTERVHVDEQGRIGHGGNWSHVGPELDKQPSSGIEALRSFDAAVAVEMAKQSAAYAIRQTELAARNRLRALEEVKRQSDAAEYRREKEESDSIAKAESDRREAEKSSVIDAFVAASGDTLMIRQHADGLLCRKHAISLIANAAFASFSVPDAIQVPDTCTESECPCCDKYIDCIPTYTYQAWRAIADHLPDGHTVKFSRVRECLRDDSWEPSDGESARPAYITADITLPHGPFKFERRIRLESK